MIVELFCDTYGWTISEVLDDHTFSELEVIMDARLRNHVRKKRSQPPPVFNEGNSSGVREQGTTGETIMPSSKADFEALAAMGAPVKVLKHGE